MMNKQELIDKLKKQLTAPSEIDGTDFNKFYELAINYALYFAERLDEPEKPVVPQCVAEWYEKNKDGLEWNLYTICVDFYKRELQDDLHNWFRHNDNKPIETLVKMKLYGYEVEKEKMYKVSLKRNGLGMGIQQQDGSFKEKFTKTELSECGFDDLDVYEIKEVEE